MGGCLVVGRKDRRKWDPRHFIKVSTDIFDNPKIVDAGDPYLELAYAKGLIAAGKSLTDGQINPNRVLRDSYAAGRSVDLAGRTMSILDALIEQGLWHTYGHTCPDCRQPKPGMVMVHHYLNHNLSKQEWQQDRENKARGGRISTALRYGHDLPDPTPAETPATTPAAAPAVTAASNLAGIADTLAQPPAPGTPRRTPATRRTRLSENFGLTTAMRQWAQTNTPDVDTEQETKHFIDHYLGLGEPRDNWIHTWQSWMRNAAKRTTARRGPPRYQETGGEAARLRAQEMNRRA